MSCNLRLLNVMFKGNHFEVKKTKKTLNRVMQYKLASLHAQLPVVVYTNKQTKDTYILLYRSN